MTSALSALVIGAVLGFALSIPAAGPLLGLVVIAGATGHRRQGLALAVGGAIAETGWALLSFWGLAHLIERHAEWTAALRALSAILLLAIAVALLRPRDSRDQPTAPHAAETIRRPALLGFALVALNPGFGLLWASVATALYASRIVAPSAVIPLAIGVFAGIVAWFSLVLGISQRTPRSALTRLKRAVAALLVVFALYLAVQALVGGLG